MPPKCPKNANNAPKYPRMPRNTLKYPQYLPLDYWGIGGHAHLSLKLISLLTNQLVLVEHEDSFIILPPCFPCMIQTIQTNMETHHYILQQQMDLMHWSHISSTLAQWLVWKIDLPSNTYLGSIYWDMSYNTKKHHGGRKLHRIAGVV